MSSDTFDGGCACGEVRYRMEDKPLVVHCCHCRWCQRETGASFALNAMIEADRITVLQGKPERILTPSNSGEGQAIWRCPSCQVALWSHYAGAQDKLSFVRVGTLDEAGSFSPNVHIFTSSKQPWVVIADDLPVFEEYYDKKKLWSEESLARLERAFE